VRTDSDTPFARQAHRLAHHIRVAGVGTTGDVGRGHVGQERGVVAQDPRAEALAAITVQIDAHAAYRMGEA
jgi:hypothetical protein